ncbi:unnamed protein product [Rangifer tarandus platyrhynchus]|uniref:Uncharacterized protein n=1 Tax=Rangifer tarandus platyrhynchus TaxID=3082113 RepID=A0ABN8ZZW5_RANTA|nr:unnamed protein product [Rangifer tarandus platyrhynchus]
MPPRAGKGARGRGGGRPPRAGPGPPAFDSINWAPSFRRGGDAAGDGGRPRSRGETASPGSGLGRGRWHHPHTPTGPRTALPPPHCLGPGGGSELGCPLEIPYPQHTLRRADPVPGLGVGARPPAPPPPPRRVRAWVVPLVPGRGLFTSIPLVTGELGIDSSFEPLPGKGAGVGKGRGWGAPNPGPRGPQALPGSHPLRAALPPHPIVGPFRGVISAIHLSGSREVEIVCLDVTGERGGLAGGEDCSFHRAGKRAGSGEPSRVPAAAARPPPAPGPARRGAGVGVSGPARPQRVPRERCPWML